MENRKYFNLTVISMMIALTIIMVMTPIGTIPIGVISITIAHIPILITTIVIGFKEGMLVAFAFGLSSLLKALLMPQGLLDPLFINPLISIVPRLIIPITTFLVYRGTKKTNKTFATTAAVVVGNLTNTFFVYFSMYLFVRSKVESLTGKNFMTVIVGLVSTTTAIKTVGVALLTVPIIMGLQRYLLSAHAAE